MAHRGDGLRLTGLPTWLLERLLDHCASKSVSGLPARLKVLEELSGGRTTQALCKIEVRKHLVFGYLKLFLLLGHPGGLGSAGYARVFTHLSLSYRQTRLECFGADSGGAY